MRPACEGWMNMTERSGAVTTQLKRKNGAVTKRTMTLENKLKRKKRAVTKVVATDVAVARKGGVMARAQHTNVKSSGCGDPVTLIELVIQRMLSVIK